MWARFFTARWQAALSAIIALAGPFGLAGVLGLARTTLPASTTVLLLVLTVVAITTLVGRPLVALLAGSSAAAGFDFFHTRPYGSFTITQRDDVQAAILLLMTASLVGELVAWGRRHRDWAREAATDLTRVSEVEAAAATGESEDRLVLLVADQLCAVLSLRDCRFDQSGLSSPGHLDDHGCVIYGGLGWPADTQGLPGPQLDLEISWLGTPLGRFVMTPTAGVPVPQRRRHTALALARAVAPRLWMRQAG